MYAQQSITIICSFVLTVYGQDFYGPLIHEPDIYYHAPFNKHPETPPTKIVYVQDVVHIPERDHSFNNGRNTIESYDNIIIPVTIGPYSDYEVPYQAVYSKPHGSIIYITSPIIKRKNNVKKPTKEEKSKIINSIRSLRRPRRDCQWWSFWCDDNVWQPKIISDIVIWNLGSEVTFTCTAGNVDIQTEWTHTFQSQVILKYEARDVTRKYILKLEEFDNNSNVTCSAKRKNENEKKIAFINIKIQRSNPAPSYGNIKKVKYTNKTKISYYCTKHKSNIYKASVVLLKGNYIKNYYTERIEEYFNTNDNGTIISCLFMLHNGSHFQRIIENKTMLIYEENVGDVRPLPEKDLQLAVSSAPERSIQYQVETDSKVDYEYYYYIGGACLLGAVIIVLLILTIIKFKSIPPTPDNKDYNAMYINAAPIYGNVELSTLQSGDRVPEVDESSHGPVSYSNMILYAQLDLPIGERTPHILHEESPYAQILDMGPSQK